MYAFPTILKPLDLYEDAIIRVVPHETYTASFAAQTLNTHTIKRQRSSPAPSRWRNSYMGNRIGSLSRHVSLPKCSVIESVFKGCRNQSSKSRTTPPTAFLSEINYRVTLNSLPENKGAFWVHWNLSKSVCHINTRQHDTGTWPVLLPDIQHSQQHIVQHVTQLTRWSAIRTGILIDTRVIARSCECQVMNDPKFGLLDNTQRGQADTFVFMSFTLH